MDTVSCTLLVLNTSKNTAKTFPIKKSEAGPEGSPTSPNWMLQSTKKSATQSKVADFFHSKAVFLAL